MGPDCGTAVVGGVALGFANAARAGPVGIVAASGTGAQQVMCLLDAAGVGVSHCLGVGGRDLSAAVRGRSTRQALAALAADPATDSIVVVSKPPAPEVLQEVQAYAATLGKPVLWATLGQGRPDLTAREAALSADAALGGRVAELAAWSRRRRPAARRRCGACSAAARSATRRCSSPARPSARSGPTSRCAGAGARRRPAQRLPRDDRLRRRRPTQGRAHPMIDPTLRLERIAAESGDPTCGVLLLDLVLGYGAHPHPADELAEAITAAVARAADDGRELPVVVSLTGAENDPQGLTTLRHHPAVRRGLGVPLQRPGHPPRPVPTGPRFGLGGPSMTHSTTPLHGLLSREPSVVTAGVSLFADALREQAAQVTEVDWRPPMGGTEADLARVMADPRREEANRTAVSRLLSAGAELVDVRPASEVLGIERGHVLPRRAAAVLGPRLGPDEGRAGRRDAVRGAGRQPRGGRARARPRLGHPRPVPPPPRRGPDGRRDLAVDVDVRAPRPGARRQGLLLAERGARQGAALRRLRPRGDRAAALDGGGARPGAAAGGPRHTDRSTSRRSSPRCCRWATRGTTATGPAR